MSFKGKTYSKKGSGGSKTGNPFDRMMKEQCNKPVAAKSAGIVGKWGATSFTSVRGNADQNTGDRPKVKKFFKSRTENAVVHDEAPITVATVAAARIIAAPEKPNKKIFRSKNAEEASRTAPESAPSRSSRLTQRSQGRSGDGNRTERSPLQDKDWPCPPSSSPPPVADTNDIKKLPVPRPRRTRQQVPDENPVDKESRLLALFNSQSKENHPSEQPSRSRRAISQSHESQKRKVDDENDANHPPIKLKLSLSKSSDSEKYKVVKNSDTVNVNNSSDSSSDFSNDWKSSKMNSYSHQENIIEQSDLELLEADFVSDTTDPPRTRERSPPKEAPPRKLPRNNCDENDADDMFNLLLQTKPKRSKRINEVVPDVAANKPAASEKMFDQIFSAGESNDTNTNSSRKEVPKYSSRRRQAREEFVPDYDSKPSPVDHNNSEPLTKVPTQPPEPKPVSEKPTYNKKTIFKSRNKPPPSPPPTTSDQFSLDFDDNVRVPPLPVIEPTPPSSSQSELENSQPVKKESKSRNKFFKSKNKNSDLSKADSPDLYPSSQSSVRSTSSSLSTFSLDIGKKSDSALLRSPSPDPIQFPARIATPSKSEASVAPIKKSIFKHKAKESKETASKILPKKAMSLYKHRMGWGGDREEFKSVGNDPGEELKEKNETDDYDYDDEFDSEPIVSNDHVSDLSFAPSKLTRVATYPTRDTGFDMDTGDMVTQVKCPKSYKGYYTVIKNVKAAHEINDHGEFQEFNDDVEYICDGMKPRNKISSRCLAAISLAQKCMKPNFRMHLRAHGEVSKFFSELKDAPSNSSLALCTSTILFVLSQDRLNMDMDRDSLELLLNLLDTDCNIRDALDDSGFDKKELEKNKQKVIEMCTEMKSKGHAGTLNLDKISADHLAMETLLSMTSKRAGEWFKEELRELGGLAHLARTFTDCVSYLTIKEIKSWSDQLGEKLKKANRILRVLENISHENEENCNYLIEYGRTVETQEQEFAEVLQKLFKLLDEEVQLNPTTDTADKESVGVILRDTLFSVIRVHINLVHDYRNKPYGSLEIGQKEGCMYRVLRCIFIMPYWFCPLGKRFEALVLSLTLLINMVEHSDENRQSLMDSMAAQKDADFCVKEEPRMAVEDLVQLFVDRDTLAK